MKKTATVDLKGKAYATVPARVKEFRTDNPQSDIKTEYKMEGDMISFSAYVIKDKANQNSASATGHSIGKFTGEKAFEKLETIAVGRALALLGYLASGDIASSEEMEEFIEYQENKKIEARMEAIDKLDSCKTLQELQDTWKSLGTIIQDDEVVARKDALKATLK